ncbi:MAG: hypothetical protein EZS28_011505 [Streblomastix strix]|uniref:Uncharacterized protein n=1 Tax=Streblomastix strix TaxID=222440 RepID=A0A5J4WEZ6_9EUKA|nr:MAG: hypothetical protein EZS28_011505 [Streblomastix strix]
MSVIALNTVLRFSQIQKYSFQSCCILEDSKLIVGTTNGFLLFFNLDKPEEPQKENIPYDIVDIGKFNSISIFDQFELIYLQTKDSVCRTYNIVKKESSNPIKATKGTLFFTVGAIRRISLGLLNTDQSSSQLISTQITPHINAAGKTCILICAQEIKKRDSKKFIMFYYWDGITFIVYNEIPIKDII